MAPMVSLYISLFDLFSFIDSAHANWVPEEILQSHIQTSPPTIISYGSLGIPHIVPPKRRTVQWEGGVMEIECGEES
jgi:hypothetical protein